MAGRATRGIGDGQMDGTVVKDREQGLLRERVKGVPLSQSPVLVHVGLARTGTTWLQKHVFANSPHIFTPADPSLEPMERAKQLARRLCKDDRERLINELDFDIDAFRRECDSIEVPAGKAAVISSERLSGSVLSGGFDRAIISRRIKAVFPKARILLVIREQRALLMSMYIQYLKYGGWHTIGDFVDPESDGRLPCFSPSYLMYDRLIGLYQDTFGRGQCPGTAVRAVRDGGSGLCRRHLRLCRRAGTSGISAQQGGKCPPAQCQLLCSAQARLSVPAELGQCLRAELAAQAVEGADDPELASADRHGGAAGARGAAQPAPRG
jgi:hypothetical protein